MDDRERCPVTRKLSYPTRKAARAHQRSVSKVFRRNVFRCGWCECYHVGRPRGRGGGRA